MRWMGIAALLLLTACGKDASSPSPRSAGGGQGGGPATAADAASPAPRADAAAAAPTDTCVADCVQRNQMKATSPEVIEADCRAECASK